MVIWISPRSRPLGDMTSRTAPDTGTCPICSVDNICLIPSSGLLRRHGFGPGLPQCAGTHCLPVAGSISSSSSTSSLLPPSQSIHHGSGQGRGRPKSSAIKTSATVETSARDKPLIDTPVQPSSHIATCGAEGLNFLGGTRRDRSPSSSFTQPARGSKILRWIPKGARGASATLLQTLLMNVERDPSSPHEWSRLMGFASACFGRPDRGGRSSNLTKGVLRSVADYGSGGLIGGDGDRRSVRGGGLGVGGGRIRKRKLQVERVKRCVTGILKELFVFYAPRKISYPRISLVLARFRLSIPLPPRIAVLLLRYLTASPHYSFRQLQY